MIERIASFARLIMFDKRGTGLSDPVVGAPMLEERMDDVRAVMEAAGSERAALLGASEGVPMCDPVRGHPSGADHRHSCSTAGMARSTWAPDYPVGHRRPTR